VEKLMKKYHITLTDEERQELEEMTRKGTRNAQVIRNALVLLNCDENNPSRLKKDSEIASILGITERTIENIRKKFVVDGYEIAFIIALSCSEPPEGFSRWSLRMLADKAVELNYIDSISHERVRSVLKKRVKTVDKKGVGHTSSAKQ
jgi:hypothetical protein